MNKSELKNFAINARLELLQRVADRAALYGIDEENSKARCIVPSDAFHKVGGAVLTAQEISQRSALVARVYRNGYRQTMEEAAYTWFNRLIALRYMQAHNLLPVPMRVLPDAPGAQPQLVKEAQDAALDGVDMQQVLSMLDTNQTEALYKYLLIALCNALSRPLPAMFETISDYTELLFPDGLLRPDSVLGQLAQLEEDCWNEIQVIGWLYQYYNTQLKDETFELLKKNVKITKDRIGAATQLFTPEWIVRYMVENSLGRLWQEGHPQPSLRLKWRYYMDEAEQEPQVAKQLAEIRKPCADIQPEQITVLDPCMGSGHILVYAFDVLMDIYRSVGYTDRDAVKSIVENNLYGLDIDDRAAQLAYFALMMKACEYDRRFLRRGIQPHVCPIAESTPLDDHQLAAFGAEKPLAQTLLATFADAKEYGSILHVNLIMPELNRLRARLDQMKAQEQTSLLAMADSADAVAAVEPLLMQAETLVRKYDVVVTNPPYMGSSGMNEKLSKLVKDEYPDSKSDLFAVFMERCGETLNDTGYQAMITQHAWMFLSSFERLRGKLQKRELINMAHLGARAFEEIGGEVVQTTAFVMKPHHTPVYKGSYARLIEPTTQAGKEQMFLAETNRYTAQQENFTKIPGMPVAYWVSEAMIRTFLGKKMRDYGFAGIGMRTGDNERFLRYWYEISMRRLLLNCSNKQEQIDSNTRWIPYNKGGNFRRWYGNNEYVVNWENDGYEIKENTKRIYPQLGDNLGWKISNENYYYLPGITWSGVTSGLFACRCYGKGFIFDSGANGLFPNANMSLQYLAGVLNSKYANTVINIINPTINTGAGTVNQIPVIKDVEKMESVEQKVEQCISTSQNDWDSFETSWDFKKHPLI